MTTSVIRPILNCLKTRQAIALSIAAAGRVRIVWNTGDTATMAKIADVKLKAIDTLEDRKWGGSRDKKGNEQIV
jgi:hypothetical protein